MAGGNSEIKDALGVKELSVLKFGMSGPASSQITTSGQEATFVEGAGTALNNNSTFDGYTVGQVVRALRSFGFLQ